MAFLHRWAIKLEVYVRSRPATLFQVCSLVWLLDLGSSGYIALIGAITSSSNLLGGLIRGFDVKALRNLLAYLRWTGHRQIPQRRSPCMGPHDNTLRTACSVRCAPASGGRAPG
jgi:hypothetical protein